MQAEPTLKPTERIYIGADSSTIDRSNEESTIYMTDIKDLSAEINCPDALLLPILGTNLITSIDLSMSKDNFTTKQLCCFVTRLAAEVSTIKNLSLKHCEIKDEDLIYLIGELDRLDYKLDSIDLQENFIGSDGIIALAKSKLVHNLSSINLSDGFACGIELFGDAGMILLCETLALSTKIHTLKVKACGITTASIEAITMLIKNSTLKVLGLGCNPEIAPAVIILFKSIKGSNLCELDLSGIECNSKVSAYLGSNLRKTNLVRIYFHHCFVNINDNLCVVKGTVGSKILLLNNCARNHTITNEELLKFTREIKKNNVIQKLSFPSTTEICEHLLDNAGEYAYDSPIYFRKSKGQIIRCRVVLDIATQKFRICDQ